MKKVKLSVLNNNSRVFKHKKIALLCSSHYQVFNKNWLLWGVLGGIISSTFLLKANANVTLSGDELHIIDEEELFTSPKMRQL